MQKLPIGIQTFSTIRNDNYIYIDKTKEALDLIEKYKFVFLSRPRRFGKSLFVDTLQNIFEAKKDLFKGLYIYDKYDWNENYPVIKINFSDSLSSQEILESNLKQIFQENEKRLNVKCDENLPFPTWLHQLIVKTYEKYNRHVAVLIDEYDKPLLDVITDIQRAQKVRDYIRDIYSVIKPNDKYIKFAFLTGVSKFSKVSLFSGLNNLMDITLHKDYGNICGYTQTDIETTFKDHLKDINLKELKEWYDGYNFLKDKVYNPYDILLFIDNNFTYRNYWFETGTPTFLLKLIKEQNYYLPNLETAVVGDEILNSFDINKINIEVLLFQAGYLTIKEAEYPLMGGILYHLKIPNKEVQMSLSNSILGELVENPNNALLRNKSFMALKEANLTSLKENLITLFANIPYTNYSKNHIFAYEGYYSSVIFSYLYSLGLKTTAESSTNKGRIDLAIEIENNIYIIEFKVGSKNALEQIKEKKYYEKFQNKEKQIYLVGINFDEKEKNISKFEWEKL